MSDRHICKSAGHITMSGEQISVSGGLISVTGEYRSMSGGYITVSGEYIKLSCSFSGTLLLALSQVNALRYWSALVNS